MKHITIHFDGGARPKIGVYAGAAVAYDDDGVELATRAQLMRDVTVPIAEYTGLILGLNLARELEATHVDVLGDAELIVRQVDGRYACRNARLRPLLAMVKLLMEPFEECRVREFPKAGPKMKRRWGNERADQLANECMDGAT